MTSIAFYTLGCKSNQYETNGLMRDARRMGFRIADFHSPANVYVINTCTVTENADRKARNVIRLAKKRNPNAKVIVSGCYAEVYPDEIRKLGVDLVAGNKDKKNILSCLGLGTRDLGLDVSKTRVRENLMIEDGCEEFCSYCVVPYARGKIKTKAVEQVIKEAKELVSSGAKEIVLTGINLGAYGPKLPELLKDISGIEGLLRIRLSSIEPMYITEKLLGAVKSSPKVCSHLHIPLQSGSTKVLRTMGRRYTAGSYKKLIAGLRKKIPGIALNTDIIVGFPGETEEDFKKTLSLVKDLRFSRVHVFHFSPRPGTRAAEMADWVKPHLTLERMRRLRALGSKMMEAFAKKEKSGVQVVLAESAEKWTGMLEGLTEGYTRVRFRGKPDLIGRLVRVRITGIRDGYCTGKAE